MPRPSTIKTGDRFGKLVAVETMQARSPEGFVRWLCQCDCGQLKVVASGMLKIGNNQSCGCMVGYGNQKLTDDQIAAILASAEKDSVIAEKFGIHRTYVKTLRDKHK